MISISKVKRYCKDYTNIENYDKAVNDESQMWECHHRNEQYYTRQDLKKMGLYYDCPPCELIFLTESEHMQIRKTCAGHDETRRKQSESLKGERHPLYGKHHSEEHKRKISEANKGERHPQYGKHWYNNEKSEIIAFECPEGFVLGRISWKK